MLFACLRPDLVHERSTAAIVLGPSLLRPVEIYILDFRVSSSPTEGWRDEDSLNHAQSRLAKRLLRALVSHAAEIDGGRAQLQAVKLFVLIRGGADIDPPPGFIARRSFQEGPARAHKVTYTEL